MQITQQKIEGIRISVVNSVVGNVKQQLAALDTAPEMIALLRSQDQADLEEHWPELKGLPIEAHERALAEIKERLEDEVPQMTVSIITFDRDAYADWLGDEDDTEDMRLQYAAERTEAEG